MLLIGHCVCFVKRVGERQLGMMQLWNYQKKIINLSELDSIIHVRLTNISDLVASEGKYHLSCWIQFERKVNKIKDIATNMDYGKQKSQQSLYRLCSDLISGLGSGYIYMTLEMYGYFMNKCVRKMTLMFHNDISVEELHFMMILRKL